ncbi:unnamed protein product, partial [Staurois parvus]
MYDSFIISLMYLYVRLSITNQVRIKNATARYCYIQGRTDHLETRPLPERARDAPGTFFIGFFEFGQGHKGPMIPYCPGGA